MLFRPHIIVLLLFVNSFVYGQDKEYITIGVGYDLLSFKGDLNQDQRINSLNNFRGGYNFFVEKRFLGLVGISANALFGKVSQYENSSIRNLYFQSKVMQFDARLSLYLDNKYLLGHTTLFTPFLSVGIGYLKFDPYGDLLDGDGSTYYYWNDGTVKDLPETEENELTAEEIERDYEYETQLTDVNNSYSRGTMIIPLTFGVNCKLSDKFNARVAGTYAITGSDYIDNTSSDNKKDKIISTNFSLTYTIGKSEDNAHQNYKDTDFDDLFNEDHDADGVMDIDDQCQHTPTGVKVDVNGCPLDSDKDGIVDYLDKEENTPNNVHVNEFGETITDEEFLKRSMLRDSTGYTHKILTEHHVTNIDELSEFDSEIDEHNLHVKHKPIPVDFIFADFDGDGVIHSIEVARALDEFLDGELDISVEQLYDMIDFFFEQ
ncbi:MAG: hypothetical protein JKY53_02335 [Flavobacteriales bacterium]|nr:hypothetical protein [Flavobacteriales bacterium]